MYQINIKKIFSFFKIHHSIKNVSIFLPILASHQFSNINLTELILFFINISFLSIIIYSLNNIYDYEFDLKNKKIDYKINLNRKNIYYLIGFIIFCLQIFILIYLKQKIWIICLFYFSLAILYNTYLKKVKYLDIFTICIFHIIRIYYGSIAFNINLSFFFIIFFIFIFMMIAINKRISEIELNYLNRPYKKDDLKTFYPLQVTCAFFSLIIFIFYIINPNSNFLYYDKYLLILNLFILFLILTNFIIYQKKHKSDVTIFFIKNKLNYLLSILFLIIYLKNSLFF